MADTGLDIYNKIGIHFSLVSLFALIFLLLGFNHNLWNGLEEADDDTWWKKLFNRFYYTTITYSTIGYGDISPKSKFLKFLTIVFAFIMIAEILSFMTP